MNGEKINRIVYPIDIRKRLQSNTEDSKQALESNLSGKINSLEEALRYIRQIAFKCEVKTEKSQRAKYRSWRSIYDSFFNKLNICKHRADGQKWRLETIKIISDLVGIDSIPDMDKNLTPKMKALKKREIISKFFKKVEDGRGIGSEVQEFLLLLQEKYIFSKYKRI